MRARAQAAVAAILFAIGIGAMGASAWLYWRAWPSVKIALAKGADIGGEQGCLQVGAALGLETSPSPTGGIDAGMKTLDNPSLAFGKASAMIAACRGYTLSTFCAGQGCGEKTLRFHLAPIPEK